MPIAPEAKSSTTLLPRAYASLRNVVLEWFEDFFGKVNVKFAELGYLGCVVLVDRLGMQKSIQRSAKGTTYTDLGATITGPQADLNLGITTFVNGAPMEPRPN